MPQSEHMSWETLVRIALLGSQRAILPDELLRILIKAGIVEADDATWLLRALSWTWLRRRAGFPLEKWSGGLPTPPPSTTSQKVIGQSAISLLKRLTQPQWREGLPEFIWQLRQHKRTIPDELWPALFDCCTAAPRLWPLLAPIADARARWIATQHLPWLKAISSAPATLHSGTQDQWLELLRLRKTQPACFAQAWQAAFSARPSWQNALLQILERQLQPTDLPLVVWALEVAEAPSRYLAATLLARFEQHPFRTEILAALARTLHPKRQQLHLTFDDSATFDLWWRRLAMDSASIMHLPSLIAPPNTSSHAYTMQEAYWLWYLLSLVPPKLLLQHLGWGPNRWVQAAARTHFAGALLGGSALAVRTFGYNALLRALWDFWIEAPPTATHSWPWAMQALLDVTPSHTYSQWMVQVLQRQKNLNAAPAARTILAKAQKAWSDELVQRAWQLLSAPLWGSGSATFLIELSAQTHPQLWQVLERAAWHSRIAHLQQLLESTQWMYPQSQQRIAAIVQLRAEIHLCLLQ